MFNLFDKNRPFAYLITAAAFMSFLISVFIWFFNDSQMEAIFVGIWVPSILALGTFIQVSNKNDK